MGIQHNIATVIRAVMTERQMTLTQFSAELEISRSALQNYLREEGNPSIATVEHLARKLDVDPEVLLTGVFQQDQVKVLIHMFEAIQDVSNLPEERKQLFGERIVGLLQLWDDPP